MNPLSSTPVEEHEGFLVKREDLCTIGTAGPPFSKMRGVIEHVANRPESVIGVLDTYHSQGGHAVSFACSLLGKQCVNYWPRRKADAFKALSPQQVASQSLGAGLIELPAGRSAVLYHRAKTDLNRYADSYMMPNALKLPEMITATMAEVAETIELATVSHVVVSISSGTIAAGVLAGLDKMGWKGTLTLHMGYTRPERAVMAYMSKITRAAVGYDPLPSPRIRLNFIDEGYAYGDPVHPCTPFPSNVYYDAKAWRWLMNVSDHRLIPDDTLFWNIGA